MRPATASGTSVAMLERCKERRCSMPAVDTEQPRRERNALAIAARASQPGGAPTTLSAAFWSGSVDVPGPSHASAARVAWSGLASAAVVLTVVGAHVHYRALGLAFPVSATGTATDLAASGDRSRPHGTTSPGVPSRCGARVAAGPARTCCTRLSRAVEPPAAPGVPAGLRVPGPSSDCHGSADHRRHRDPRCPRYRRDPREPG